MATAAAPALLAEVDIRHELASRPYRHPDYEAEARALADLAARMAEKPRDMLQGLVEVALELCDAGTAGISLLEGDVFRWEALAGVFASKRGGTMPRDASPCGVCIDQNATQLMSLPDRRFPALLNEPRFVEALLVPFTAHGQALGTVWVAAHTAERRFDREDERLIRALAGFASAGWQLWQQCVAAEKASARKDEFLAMLGHELRNPLSTVCLAVTVAKTEPRRRDDALGIAERQCRHLGRLVDDLLDVARVTHGKIALRRAPVSIEHVLNRAVESTRALVERYGHALHLAVPAEPLFVDGDTDRLLQIFTNLLANAVTYTPLGGRIDARIERIDRDVVVQVRDDGMGLDADMLPHVFDLFAQASGANRRVQGGLGLGLTVVKEMVELHGGHVSVHSDGPGRGSTFTVVLPLLDDVAAFAPPVRLQTVTSSARARVLLVEDNPDAADALAMLLQSLGHDVRTVHRGEDALADATRSPADVVLIDIGLPTMDGYEVATKIRRISGMSDAVLVALTGYGATKDKEHSTSAGFDHHMTKPVDLGSLQALLAKAGTLEHLQA
jgi:signal transduction histidine kinase/ActR/RegA family two-component response regulator